MKRFVSLFLSLMILLCCVVPVSATGLDSSTDGYSIDAMPYLAKTYIDTSSLASGSTSTILVDFKQEVPLRYYDVIVETDDSSPQLTAANWGSSYSISLGNNRFRLFGSFNGPVYDGYNLFYIKTSGSYFRILTCNVYLSDYISPNISFNAQVTGSYYYRQYNSDGSYSNVSASLNQSYSGSSDTSLDTPLLHAHTGSYPGIQVNVSDVFLTFFLWFKWKAYDRVDLYFYNSFDDLVDYEFYVDDINVLSSVQSVVINNVNSTIVTLDFSDLNRAELSDNCYLRFRGSKELSSASSYQLFYVHNITGFLKTVSDNFWPSWLNKIINKLDNIFTGRAQDQAGADSFNDSINDQADELEDLTADLNSVTRPPLSDVNLSTSGMVDQSVVVLSTNGIGSILSNQIILRVLIMSLTFALAGFILFGKR